MRGRRRVVGLLVASLIAAGAACTNDDKAGGDSAGGNGDGKGGSRADHDTTGVTDDTIKIGWPALNQKALVDAGVATDFGDPIEGARRIVDGWNEKGGINGRKVELVASTYGDDIANLLPDMQRTCLDLTEDKQVFAVVAFSWFGDAATCVAGDHHTPLVVQTSLPSTVVDTGDDNIFMANLMWEEAVRSSVKVVDNSGGLADLKKIGVFAPLEPGMREAIDHGLKPALEDAGTKLAVDGTIPFAVPVDTAAVGAVVSRFKTEHVDAVFAMGNAYFDGAFMTEAERQGYRPTYVMSDMSEGTDDLILLFAPPKQLEHAIGASWKGHLPNPVPTEEGKACVKATTDDLAEDDVTQRVGAAEICQLLDLTRQGLEGAGKDLTRGSFVKAMEGITSVTTSGGGKGGYGPKDHTLPRQVRLVRFDLKGCECWSLAGDWVDLDD